MRFSRKSLKAVATAVSVGIGLLGASSAAQAGLVYDLRLSDGSHSVAAPVPGQTYTLELWGQIRGANTSGVDERFTFGYLTVMSSQTGGGKFTGSVLDMGTTNKVGVDDNGDPIIGPSVPHGFFGGNPSARNGAPSDLNGDGVGDWGSTADDLVNTSYVLARTEVGTGSGRGGTKPDGTPQTNGPDWRPLTGAGGIGTELKIAAWKITIPTTVNAAGSTNFNLVQPAATRNGGTAANYSTYYQDNVLTNVDNPSAASAAFGPNQGVTFGVAAIPEPATIGLLGAAAIGLLGRRRK
jgi:hypothetical protein